MFRLLFWLFVLFLALSFFGISIQEIFESPAGQANIAYLGQLVHLGWLWLLSHAGIGAGIGVQ